MARKQKCAKCGRELLYFTMVLWMGPNGYRRYPMDDKCKVEVQPEVSKQNKPICVVHGSSMEKKEITQGDVVLGHLWVCKVEGCDECYDDDEVRDAIPLPAPPRPPSAKTAFPKMEEHHLREVGR